MTLNGSANSALITALWLLPLTIVRRFVFVVELNVTVLPPAIVAVTADVPAVAPDVYVVAA